MPLRYLDFKLTLAGTPGQVTVAAQGPRGISIDPVPTELDLPAVRAAVELLQDDAALALAALEHLGAALFDALFPRKIARAFERAYEDLPEGAELRLKLTILPPELGDLPWELLYDPDVGAFLAARATLPIVRMIESGTPSASLLARRPLRVLQVQANPKDVASLDLAGSEAAIRAALGGAGEVTVLRSATPASLQAALRQGGFHVLHVDSHGYFDAEANSGYLLLETADAGMMSVSADQLASILDGSSVRLVLLAACQTAAQSQARRFSGLAQYLMRTVSRLPAVLAMQFVIPDQTAIAFFGEFYRALAEGFPVDAAVVEGRKAILASAGERPDWATPVLFLRVEDGDILREEREAPPATAGQTIVQINTGGGDYVGGNQIIYGDRVEGDKIGGHKITIGTVTGGGAAGRGARASVPQGVSAADPQRQPVGDQRDVPVASTWSEALTALRDVLAELYPTDDEARRIAAEAQVPTRRVKFSEQAVPTWHSLLQEAVLQDMMPAIIAVVRSPQEFPRHQTLAQAADACLR
jgi:hypothetical protein